MRLFVALVPPSPVADEVAHAVARLPSAIRAELKRIAPERYHLTLAFLGDVPEDHTAALVDCLRAVATDAPPLRLQVAGAGHFEERVLWLGLRGDTKPMRDLAVAVTESVTASGLPLQQKPYSPHLTVARPRNGGSVAEAVEAMASYDGPSWVAGDLVLMRSRLGVHPTYEPQKSWPLARAPRPHAVDPPLGAGGVSGGRAGRSAAPAGGRSSSRSRGSSCS
ncbi:MAG: 2,3-cyclic 3-phosphodiesterase [Frankiaceae bacterium]|jgi:2'-5' RNA ligase|nr:2,3-cyclic 3-phosphodiesterase [Frankiaceae bacterium]